VTVDWLVTALLLKKSSTKLLKPGCKTQACEDLRNQHSAVIESLERQVTALEEKVTELESDNKTVRKENEKQGKNAPKNR